MRIPARQHIIDRASDQRADAVARKDIATVKGIDTLIKNLYSGMKMRWDADGALIVRSCNTPGAVYCVTQQRCSCPAHKPCVHQRLHDLLLAMLETEAETADQEADADDALAALAEPLIAALDEAQGDSDFEADADEPARPEWHIGKLMRRLVEDAARQRHSAEAA